MKIAGNRFRVDGHNAAGIMPIPNIYTLRFSVFIMGFTSIAWQIIIIRELLVVFQGIELTIGIILGNWLLLEAAGCMFVRKIAEQTKRPLIHFTSLQLALGVCAVLGIVFLRSFTFLFNIPMGLLLGYHYVLLISFLVLAPVTLIKGAMFPFACKNMNELLPFEYPSGKVYIIEAAGAFTAGLLFVFYLIYRLDHIFLVSVLLLLNFIAVFVHLYAQQRFSVKRGIVLICIAGMVVSFSISLPKTLHEHSAKLLWYEGTLLEASNSEYSNIAALESEGQYTFFVNGVPFASVPEPVHLIEEQAHFPMLFHKNPHHTLIVGGGVGGLINEVIKHPVKEVHYAEQDPLIIEYFHRYTTPLTQREISHQSVNIHHMEGIRYLRKTPKTFDVIIVNLPIPSTLQINRYFTQEFFKLVDSRLNSGGIFSLSLPGSETFLVTELIDLNRLLYITLSEVFKEVHIIIGEENTFIASNEKSIKELDPGDLIQRLTERDVHAGLIDSGYIQYKMDPLRFGRLKDDIISGNNREINTHIHPRGVFRSMLLHSLTVAPALVDILNYMDSIQVNIYAGVIVVLAAALIIIQKKRRRSLFISNAIATTGFAGMLMYILLILYFQIYYGYVYHYIGLLTAHFMGGTAVGAHIATRRPNTSLLNIELSITGIIGLFLLISLSDLFPPAIVQAFIFICMTSMGLCTGLAYPVAVRMVSSESKTVSLQPGKLYALDLFGAFIGAVVTAVILLPSLGIHATLCLVLLLKTGSALLVFSVTKY